MVIGLHSPAVQWHLSTGDRLGRPLPLRRYPFRPAARHTTFTELSSNPAES